jgi:hypothetical protein
MLQELLRNRYAKWGAVIVFLILANIINQFYWNWGLITVKVTDAPLSKVIKSIEWQGWVKVCTNLPLDQKVSMYVDHVPLAEAMETLAANVSGPANGADQQDGNPPGNAGAGGRPGAGANPTANGGAGAPPGGPGGARGGRGGGGFGGGGATWNLAFFVAPTSGQVKDEIRAFQAGDTDDDTKVYTFPTPLQMVSSDEDMPASDPRRQSWPGVKPVDPSATPPTSDAQTNSATGNGPGGHADPAADAAPTVQTYLQALAQSANIWIMTPGSWAPPVSSAPAANSSIISAVKNLVASAHGAVTEVIVLRVGRGARGTPGGRGGGFANQEAMFDRMSNAISGLPEEAQTAARSQLDQEAKFFKDVRNASPDQQRQMIRDHLMSKIGNGDRMERMSPQKRAARFQRIVANRMAAQGKQ